MSVQRAATQFGIPSGTLYGRCKREGIELVHKVKRVLFIYRGESISILLNCSKVIAEIVRGPIRT